MSGYLFVAGRIRALESQLLQRSQVERMVGAPTAPDAFRILTELQYAQYMDQSVQVDGFGQILEQGLLEAKDLVTDGGNPFPELELLWLRYDLGNLKSAYRMHLAGAEGITHFTTEAGFSPLATLGHESLEQLIWHREPQVALAPAFAAAVTAIADDVDFARIERTLDLAWADALWAIVKKHKTQFSVGYVHRLIDGANIRAWARSRMTFETPYVHHLPHGTISHADLRQAHTIADLQDFFGGTPYEVVLGGLTDDTDIEAVIEQVESRTHQVVRAFLRDAESGSVGSVEVPLGYFERRAYNAQILKFILLSKLANLSPEHIHNRLAHYGL